MEITLLCNCKMFCVTKDTNLLSTQSFSCLVAVLKQHYTTTNAIFFCHNLQVCIVYLHIVAVVLGLAKAPNSRASVIIVYLVAAADIFCQSFSRVWCLWPT